MSGNPDFVIENGILEKYKGPGGDVTIPAGVMVIGLGSFKGCTGLTSVTIPESVTIIEGCAFEECTRLTSVTIPQSVIEIGVRAFSDTPWLKI